MEIPTLPVYFTWLRKPTTCTKVYSTCRGVKCTAPHYLIHWLLPCCLMNSASCIVIDFTTSPTGILTWTLNFLDSVLKRRIPWLLRQIRRRYKNTDHKSNTNGCVVSQKSTPIVTDIEDPGASVPLKQNLVVRVICSGKLKTRRSHLSCWIPEPWVRLAISEYENETLKSQKFDGLPKYDEILLRSAAKCSHYLTVPKQASVWAALPVTHPNDFQFTEYAVRN